MKITCSRWLVLLVLPPPWPFRPSQFVTSLQPNLQLLFHEQLAQFPDGTLFQRFLFRGAEVTRGLLTYLEPNELLRELTPFPKN